MPGGFLRESIGLVHYYPVSLVFALSGLIGGVVVCRFVACFLMVAKQPGEGLGCDGFFLIGVYRSCDTNIRVSEITGGGINVLLAGNDASYLLA